VTWEGKSAVKTCEGVNGTLPSASDAISTANVDAASTHQITTARLACITGNVRADMRFMRAAKMQQAAARVREVKT
jgi:penicillin V acylase-like amidase (Ntn superfamily)